MRNDLRMDTNLCETQQLPPLAVNLDEAGRLLGGICRRSVEHLIARQQLASLKIGDRRLVRVAEIERYLAEREQAAA